MNPGTLPRRAVDGDVAAHRPRELARDIQAKAAATGFGRVDTLELFKDARLIRRIDALAHVGDDDDRGIAVAFGAQPDHATRR